MKISPKMKIIAPVLGAVLFLGAAAWAKADSIVFWGDGKGCTYIVDNPDGTQTGYTGTVGYMNGCNPTTQCSAVLGGRVPVNAPSCTGGLSKVYSAFANLYPAKAAATAK